ncbi:MAG: YeeE/YedE thiosulfate transporter family protein [Deltaproteobacteria bacterium]
MAAREDCVHDLGPVGGTSSAPPRRVKPASIVLLAIVACATCVSLDARAQCSANASSCVQCHEVQAMRPVLQSTAPWHRDHGYGDVCAACHGGAPEAREQAAAHAGLRDPLADPPPRGAACHASDVRSRAARYRAVPAPVRASVVPPPSRRASTPPPRRSTGRDVALATIALLLAPLALVGGRRERLRGALRRASWSPYVAGVGLGVTTALTMILTQRPLAVSAAFDRLAAYAGRAIAPHSRYYAAEMTPAITWHVWLVVGLFLGALVSSLASRTFRWRRLPDTQWADAFGPGILVRALVAFIGAFLVQFGAGIAGGCTSGLAISGGTVMAPGAYLFMLGMFAGGIPTAWLVYRRGRGGR